MEFDLNAFCLSREAQNRGVAPSPAALRADDLSPHSGER